MEWVQQRSASHEYGEAWGYGSSVTVSHVTDMLTWQLKAEWIVWVNGRRVAGPFPTLEAAKVWVMLTQ